MFTVMQMNRYLTTLVGRGAVLPRAIAPMVPGAPFVPLVLFLGVCRLLVRAVRVWLSAPRRGPRRQYFPRVRRRAWLGDSHVHQLWGQRFLLHSLRLRFLLPHSLRPPPRPCH